MDTKQQVIYQFFTHLAADPAQSPEMMRQLFEVSQHCAEALAQQRQPNSMALVWQAASEKTRANLLREAYLCQPDFFNAVHNKRLLLDDWHCLSDGQQQLVSDLFWANAYELCTLACIPPVCYAVGQGYETGKNATAQAAP